jgi:hypothetical protein
MPTVSDPLIEHLHSCCVQVLGERPGCGFYIGPNLIVTCAHVIGSTPLNSGVSLRRWLPTGVEPLPPGKLLAVFADDDIAFVHSNVVSRVAALGAEAQLGDPLLAIGFPKRGNREELDQFDPTWTAGPVFAVGNGGNAEGW